MYLLVYVPDAEEAKDGNAEAPEGTWQLGERVVTDLKGNTLTDEEITRRQAQKEAQKCCKSGKKSSRSPSTSTPRIPETHEMALSLTAPVQPVQPAPSTPLMNTTKPLADHHCSCGAACACAFCPQHPNNSVSKGLVRQQAIFSTQQQFPQAQDFLRLDPSAVQFSPDRSCMGFKPSFAIGHYAVRPGAGEFQRAFPLAAGGYMLAYPMWEIEAMQNGMQQPIAQQVAIQATQPEPALSLPVENPWVESNNFDFTSQEPLFDTTQNGLEVGNAFIARNDLGSWNDPFDITASPNNFDFISVNEDDFQSNTPFIAPTDPSIPNLSHTTSEESITIPTTPIVDFNFNDPPLPIPAWEENDLLNSHESTLFDLHPSHHTDTPFNTSV